MKLLPRFRSSTTRRCVVVIITILAVLALLFGLTVAVLGEDWVYLFAADEENDDTIDYLAGLVDEAKKNQIAGKKPVNAFHQLIEKRVAWKASDLPLCGQQVSNASVTSWVSDRLDKLAKHWSAFVHRRKSSPSEEKYCALFCGLGKCCESKSDGTDGYVKLSSTKWLQTIKDDTPGWDHDKTGYQDITMVTQGSIDRMQVFGMMADAWKGPKVAIFAVYNHTKVIHQIALQQVEDLKEVAKSWTNVKVMVYYINSDKDYFTEMFRKRDGDPTKRPPLPLNTLRNIAVDSARTNFIFTVDMDFVPSTTAYSSLISKLMPAMAAVDRGVFVVPHFEAFTCSDGVKLPSDFPDMQHSMEQGRVRPFHADVKRIMPTVKGLKKPSRKCEVPQGIWEWGIESSSYTKWFTESKSNIQGFYPIHVKGPTKTIYYEPFVIVKRVDPSGASLPRYDEKYVGRFKNKISFICKLRAYHYQFYTLRQEFLTHMPHPVANVDSNAMQGHLLDMRHLHAGDRMYLNSDVYSQPPEPPLMNSPFDRGLHCTGELADA